MHRRARQGKLSRRRFFKVVACVPRRGGTRYVDIEDGKTEYHMGRPTSPCHGPPPPGDLRLRGYTVYRNETEALTAPFPTHAPLLYAKRALIEVLAGGAPTFHDDGDVTFFLLTPTCVVAEGAAFAKMHKEFFGDEYYQPRRPAITRPESWAECAPHEPPAWK